MASSKSDDESYSGISIDGDVAFAFVDFSGVDFCDYEKHAKKMPSDGSEQVKRSHIISQNNAEKCQQQEKRETQQPVGIPDGQNLLERHVHDQQLFKAQERRVENLCKWYELGTRPSLSSSSLLNLAAHKDKDDDLFLNDVDDLHTLLLRSIQAQDDLNTNFPSSWRLRR